MTWDRRFASLDGRSRRWLSDDDDIEPSPGSDFGTPVDVQSFHDGWGPIVPRGQPLARLEDVITIGARRG